jgi:hypothetical protein
LGVTPTPAVHVDDIVVKAPRVEDLIVTLDAMFANLRRFSVKLNPKKCTFRVAKGRLLGYILSERGIEANSEKITAITGWAPCQCFTATPTKGYPRGGEFVGRVSSRSGTRRCKEKKV